jgi:hypothetical protein
VLVAVEGIRTRRMIETQDVLTFFLARFTFLGEQLRNFGLPGWIPYTLSGAPYLGDPQSGWFYLPAMISFVAAPGTTGYIAMIIFHFVAAGLGTYAFARTLGMNAAGAAVAGAAYEFGAFAELTRCCFDFAAVETWIPIALLGVELATRAQTWFARVGWWAVAGFALSQILGVWLGQGAYYGLLAVVAYTAYRTLIWPQNREGSVLDRLVGALIHGGANLAIGFGLAAGGILPRLETVSGAYLNGDYSTVGGLSRGWADLRTPIDFLLTMDNNGGRWYMGGAVFALSLVSPVVARFRYATPFFYVYSIVVVLLAQEAVISRGALRLLPGFMDIHQHKPERVMIIFYIGPAMLAGATVSAIGDAAIWRSSAIWKWACAAIGLVPFAILLGSYNFFDARGKPLETVTLITVGFVSTLLVLAAILPKPKVVRLVAVALLLILFVDPIGYRIANGLPSLEPEVLAKELGTSFTAPDAAGKFLQAAQANADEPVRFFGYDPAQRYANGRSINGYLTTLWNPLTLSLYVNNRGVPFGLQDVQGYNPIQSARYVSLITAINHQRQDYHHSDILPRGMTSPLLNLLNARYIVVPSAVQPGRPDLLHMSQRHQTVYADETVRILENEDAFPRAWLVHRAGRVSSKNGFRMVESGEVDPRVIALLDRYVERPDLEQPSDLTVETVQIINFEPDRMTLKATTTGAALLVLSEVYDPGWSAFVDGKQVQVFAAFTALRAVPVPEGTHTIELRYEVPGLKLGLLVTAATAVIVAVVLGYLFWRSKAGRPLLLARRRGSSS